MTIRTSLFWLILVSLVPFLAFSAYMLQRDMDARRAQAETALLQNASTLGVTVERELLAAISALETLRHSPALSAGDFTALRATAAAIESDHPQWISVALTAPDGQVLMSTSAAPGQALPNVGQTDSIRKVIETRRTVVSGFAFHRLAQAPVIGISAPVLDGDALRYIVSISMRAQHLQDLVDQMRFPAGTIAVLADRKNVIIAASGEAKAAVGRTGALHDVRIVAGGADEAIAYGTSTSGTRVAIAALRSDLSGWLAAVVIPLALLDAPARRTFLLLAAGGAAALLLNLACAILVARRIALPLRRLSDSAPLLLSGEQTALPEATNLREVDGLARAMYSAGQDQRRAAEENRQAQMALRQAQKLEALGQLTGGIAHDFNNLLTVILGSLERPGDDGKTQQSRIGRALEAARRGTALTQKLLGFARREPLEVAPQQVNDLVAETLELLRPTLTGSITIEADLEADLPIIDTDRQQLENALINLVFNARDAMPEGGRISIETRIADLTAEDVHGHQELAAGPHVRIAVKDTGTGMDAAVLDRVFEPFFTTKKDGQGTGLGLAQVYGFVRQNKGLIRIHSRPGAGTTIHIFLPCAPSAAMAA